MNYLKQNGAKRDLIVQEIKMKKPTKPNNPSKPKQPVQQIKDFKLKIGCLYKEMTIPEIIKLVEDNTLKVPHYNLSIIDINKISIELEQSSSDYEYEDYSSCNIYYTLDLQKHPDDYKRELSAYNRKLNSYNIKKQEYNKKFSIYETEMKKYIEEQDKQNKERKKQLYEELKKEFEIA